LDINQFNQVARLAWLGKVVMQPLEPTDPECESMLIYVDYPDEMAQHFLNTDQDLIGHMHIVDREQSKALIKVLELGVRERAALYQDLKNRDFYFNHFYQSPESEQDSE
ncbi:MAG: hypothetical protein OEX00_07485, partial [Gammaproteobacteria bacterium]|nr:hypothetical protein [Gammaproteobacteria bacterium]